MIHLYSTGRYRPSSASSSIAACFAEDAPAEDKNVVVAAAVSALLLFLGSRSSVEAAAPVLCLLAFGWKGNKSSLRCGTWLEEEEDVRDVLLMGSAEMLTTSLS